MIVKVAIINQQEIIYDTHRLFNKKGVDLN